MAPSAGALDPMFGLGGKVTVPFDLGATDDFASAVAVQPDGKIVLAGGPGSQAPTGTSPWSGSMPTAPPMVRSA